MKLDWLAKIKFWDKKDNTKDASFDPQLLAMDFFSQLVYMAAIATSGIARDKLVYFASKLPYVASRYFRKVDFVAQDV